MSKVPNNLKYTATHEWIKIEGDTITVGVTDHAQAQLGDIVFVELPKMAKSVKAGDECGVIESVKAAADVYCPVPGEISEINQALTSTPELINQDPYGQGWLYKIRVENQDSLSDLLSAESYSAEISA
jgi:glycine cleavage system H protein